MYILINETKAFLILELYYVYICKFSESLAKKVKWKEKASTLWCNEIGTVRKLTLFIILQLMNHTLRQVETK